MLNCYAVPHPKNEVLGVGGGAGGAPSQLIAILAHIKLTEKSELEETLKQWQRVNWQMHVQEAE